MRINRKKFYVINSIAVALILLAFGIGFIINSASDADQQTTSSKIQANNYKKQAIESLKNNDTVQARLLFSKAKEKYIRLGDSVDVTDMEAQIYLIDHPRTK